LSRGGLLRLYINVTSHSDVPLSDYENGNRGFQGPRVPGVQEEDVLRAVLSLALHLNHRPLEPHFSCKLLVGLAFTDTRHGHGHAISCMTPRRKTDRGRTGAKETKSPVARAGPFGVTLFQNDRDKTQGRGFCRSAFALAMASSSAFTSSIVRDLTLSGMGSRPYFHLRKVRPVLG
jgi:hypothetical protein